MTDKLKCPFCGAELAPHIDEWKSIRKLFICNNTGCFCWGQPMLLEIWQALIDGKRAQDALKVARNLYQELALAHCELVDDYRTTYGCLKTPEQEAQEYMQEYDEKITPITKQEK